MRVINGQVFDLNKGFVKQELCMTGDKITLESGDDQVLDAADCYVVPGLVDQHFHGAMNEDFSDSTAEGYQKIADFELSEGVAYIAPTGMTVSEEDIMQVCRLSKAQSEKRQGAEVVGIHLEGPFLCMAKKGAQNAKFLKDPDAELLARFQEASGGLVKLVTLACEQPGSIEFIKAAKKMGVAVSLGHTMADYDTASAALEAGARQATHLYNAMPPFTHRAPGVVGAIFDHKDAYAELICDGVHIHPAVVRATFQMMGADRMILISDSLRATGMPDGKYPFGGQEIVLHGNRATMADDPNTLAGSVTSLMGCVRQAYKFGIPLYEAVRAASYNPACELGLSDRIGSLQVGRDATCVLLDKKDLSVKAIVFRGEIVKQ